MESIADEVSQHSIVLKADFVPMTVLRLRDCKLDQIKIELQRSMESAPNFFQNAPIIIDLGSINEQLKAFLDLGALCQMLESLAIVPLGIRGLSQKHHQRAKDHGLAILNQKVQQQTKASIKPAEKKIEKTEKTEKPIKEPSHTKIITKPVRSGSQIYAKDGDLLILAAVNAGAEVIADGNIHIHGPLRGRALAGAKGDEQARIFCQSLDAELIAIAGQYLVSDQFDKIKKAKSMVHIYLEANKLKIDMT
jgi:septum site-determining protein MinC